MADYRIESNTKKVMENLRRMTPIAEQEAVDMVNDSLNKVESLVVPITPIKTGNLRRGYRVVAARKLSTGRVVGVLRNNEYYFHYVNDGHRTVNGGYVKGKFMVEKATNAANMTYIPRRFKKMAINIAKKGESFEDV